MNTPSRWALHTVKPLPFFSRGRVVLVGDAVSQSSENHYRDHKSFQAHAMQPFLGIGGGMGIEVRLTLLPHSSQLRNITVGCLCSVSIPNITAYHKGEHRACIACL